MEFRILGPIEALGDDGRRLPLGGSVPRAMLATLLLETGRAVTRDRLVTCLWSTPPATAAHAVVVYASRLRRVLGPARVRCRGHAYSVHAEPEEVDLSRFRALARAGRAAAAYGELDNAVDALEAALALWAGEPLACLDGRPLVEQAREQLEEERLIVVEAAVEVRLALGGHLELVPELRALVSGHPSRERLWALLMLALYRSGRQIDALDLYARLRSRLRDELGIEPGPKLRALQRRVLAHDTGLLLDGGQVAAADPRAFRVF